MKTISLICILCCFMLLNATAEVYDHLDSRTQAYIIKQLSFAIFDSDIAILHDRCDEWLRRKDAFLSTGQEATLGLDRLRFIKMLKGTADIAHNEVIYIYKPYNKEWGILSDPRNGPVRVPPPYRPLFLAEDFMKLVFMKHQLEPIRDRVQAGHDKRDPKIKPFVEDALKMDKAGEFLAKYNLASIFSNKVYKVVEGCVFRVDYPAPDMPETESMRMNRQNWELQKAHLPKVQASNNIVHLTKREVSEIVFIAYLLDGNDGIAQYAIASKDSPILEPITRPAFETGIGKGLFEAIEKLKKPIGNASQQTTNQTAAGVPQIPGSGKTNDLGTAKP